MTTNLNTILNDLIEQAYEAGADTSPALLQRMIERDYPDAYADYASTAAASGVKNKAAKLLKNKSEEKQEALPGMNLPRFFTVPDGEGGTVSRSLLKAVLRDHRDDVAVKQRNVEAVTREFMQDSRRDGLLWSVPGAHPDMPVIEAATWLKENAGEV